MAAGGRDEVVVQSLQCNVREGNSPAFTALDESLSSAAICEVC